MDSTMMVMTILEAQVPEAKWAELAESFRQASQSPPPALLQSYLVQSSREPGQWRALSLWRSREDLEAYRTSVQTPKGVQLFRDVGADPKLDLFDVMASTAER